MHNAALPRSSHEQLVRDFLSSCDPRLVKALQEEYPTLGRQDWENVARYEVGGEDVDALVPEERKNVGVALRARRPIISDDERLAELLGR